MKTPSLIGSRFTKIAVLVSVMSSASYCLMGDLDKTVAIVSNGIQPALDAWIVHKPGGIVLAYVEGEKVRFFQAGKFSTTDSRPVGPDTFFEIGSVTKVFTALLLAESVRAGKITLDAPVGAPFSPSQITYRQLATHTSGLPPLPKGMSSFDIIWDTVSNSNHSYNPYREQALDKLKASFEAAKGSAKESPFAYSNFGYAVLGQALAGAWNQPFEELMEERVLQPAGLTDTKLSWKKADPQRLAPGHTKRGRPTDNWDQAAFAPAGALVSTTRDLAKFVQMCIGVVNTPLNASLNETMKPLMPIKKPSGEIGLAWVIVKKGDETIVWHNGATGGYHSFIGLDRTKRVGVVILTNHQDEVEDLGFAVLKDFASGSSPAK